MKSDSFLLLLVLLLLFSSAVSVYLDDGFFVKNDWVNHYRMASGDLGSYPNVYFLFPLSLRFGIVLHCFFIIPLLLVVYSLVVGARSWLVLLSYFVLLVPFVMVGHGFLKQAIITELLLVVLVFRLVVGRVGWLLGVPLVLFQPVQRTVGYWRLFFVSSFNNFGVNEQWSGVFGVFLVLFALSVVREADVVLFGLVAWVLGFFESRVFITLLVLFLPFLALFVEEKFGGVLEWFVGRIR